MTAPSGPLVDAGAVEARCLEVLRENIGAYVDYAATEAGRTLAPIKSFAVVSEYDRFPEEGLPALIVAAPGLIEPPTHDGEGLYTGLWAFEVSVTAAGRNGSEARRHSQLYAAAVRGCMLQQPLDNPPALRARCMAWMDEAYTDVPSGKRRSMVASADVFAIEVQNMVNIFGQAEGPGFTEVGVDVGRVEAIG